MYVDLPTKVINFFNRLMFFSILILSCANFAFLCAVFQNNLPNMPFFNLGCRNQLE